MQLLELKDYATQSNSLQLNRYQATQCHSSNLNNSGKSKQLKLFVTQVSGFLLTVLSDLMSLYLFISIFCVFVYLQFDIPCFFAIVDSSLIIELALGEYMLTRLHMLLLLVNQPKQLENYQKISWKYFAKIENLFEML